MTVYAKIENNKLITAYNGYNGITGLADSPELCLANGFTAYTEEEISGYYANTYQIIDGVLTDISNTPEYIQEYKQKQIKELSIDWAEKEKKYIQMICKTECCNQAVTNINYKSAYQLDKEDFLNQVIAINTGE